MRKYLLIILLVGIVLVSGCAKQKANMTELPPSPFEQLNFNFSEQPVVNEPVDLILSLKPKESMNISVRFDFSGSDKIEFQDNFIIDNETGWQIKKWEITLNKQEFKEFKTKIKFLDTQDWCGSVVARISVNGEYYSTLKLFTKFENQEIDIRTNLAQEYVQSCKEIKFNTTQLPVDYASSVYYQELASRCRESASANCCIASVEAMKAGNYTLAPETGCPEGFQGNMLRCIDSLKWCEPIK